MRRFRSREACRRYRLEAQREKCLDDEGEPRGKSKRGVEHRFVERVGTERTGRFWNGCDGDEVNGEVRQEETAMNGHWTVAGCKGALDD